MKGWDPRVNVEENALNIRLYLAGKVNCRVHVYKLFKGK